MAGSTGDGPRVARHRQPARWRRDRGAPAGSRGSWKYPLSVLRLEQPTSRRLDVQVSVGEEAGLTQVRGVEMRAEREDSARMVATVTRLLVCPLALEIGRASCRERV